VLLSREPAWEFAHEEAVKEAARCFVSESHTNHTMAGLDMISEYHILLSVRPVGDGRAERRIPIADIGTDRIKAIISYASAAATTYQRGAFYSYINQHSWFRASTGYLFKKLVLTWLSSDPEAATLLCASTGWPDLLVPACGENRMTYFSDLDALKKTTVDEFPFCLLPRYPSLLAADAIIYTDRFVITVQVTVSRRHSAKEGDFTTIADSLPICIRDGRDWCHVFITDEEWKARSLRGQNLIGLPGDIRVYSGVYNVGQRGIFSGCSWALDEDNVCGSSLRASYTYLRNQHRVLESTNIDDVDHFL
jgi:hypothetical protein